MFVLKLHVVQISKGKDSDALAGPDLTQCRRVLGK